MSMAIVCYLAMTAAELSVATSIPPHLGWMSCHFSSSGQGLSNIPTKLPPNSLLIVDDSVPFQNHNIQEITFQLEKMVYDLSMKAIVLDFQRKNQPDIEQLVTHLHTHLPCPVIAPPWYAPKDAPVFLPPAPIYQPLEIYLTPFQGRDIWLDAAPLPVEIAVTATNCTYSTLPIKTFVPDTHNDCHLHCHYSIEVDAEVVKFRLHRTKEDIAHWVHYAEHLGVNAMVCLYQEAHI